MSYYIILFFMSWYWRFFNFNNFYMMFRSINFYLSTLCFIMICFTIDVGIGKILRIYDIIVDPLHINLDDFDKDIQDKTIELIRAEFKDDKNDNKENFYTGSAFTQSENKEILNI